MKELTKGRAIMLDLDIISSNKEKTEELIFDQGTITFIHDGVSSNIEIDEYKYNMITNIINETLHSLIMIPMFPHHGKWKVVIGDEEFEGSLTGLRNENFDLTEFINLHLGLNFLGFGRSLEE